MPAPLRGAWHADCLGTDHAGYAYKEALKAHLSELGHEPIDYGCYLEETATILICASCGSSCCHGHWISALFSVVQATVRRSVPIKCLGCDVPWHGTQRRPRWGVSTIMPMSWLWEHAKLRRRMCCNLLIFSWRLPSRAAVTSDVFINLSRKNEHWLCNFVPPLIAVLTS